MNSHSDTPVDMHARFSELMSDVAHRHIWVVGDLMLDEYVNGDVARISPEAPVPVMRVHDIDYRLGGAANVAAQIVALGARATLIGLLGRDAQGDRMLQMCAAAGIDTKFVARDASRPTTRKVRVVSRSHQMLRMDWEDAKDWRADDALRVLNQAREVGSPDAIVLSDYAKGVLTRELIEAVMTFARQSGCRVIVDPKRRTFGDYRGAHVVTPNLSELQAAAVAPFDASDTDQIDTVAKSLASSAGIEAMIVTLGSRGLLVSTPDNAPSIIPAAGRLAVADTTGAGDTVVALVATCIAAGASLHEAAFIANTSAAISVGAVGTVVVDPRSISDALVGKGERKILRIDEVKSCMDRWRREGKRIAFTNGCFDVLHTGHLALLRSAALQADKLVVAINSDRSVKRLKGDARPVVSEGDRAAMIEAMSCVDAVVMFDEDTPAEILYHVAPDVLVKGADYRIDEVVGREFVESYGGKVILVPLEPFKSTTRLLHRIATSVPDASALS